MPRPASPLAWVGVAACLLAHLGLAAWNRSQADPETYVLTPYIEVQPGAAPLGADEAAKLAEELQGPVDARKIAHGYAWLGSTLSLQDLVDGIAGLAAAGHPLTARQQEALRAEVEANRVAYDQVQGVQREILDLERAIDQDVATVLAALPPEQAARVRQGMQRGPR